MGQVLLTVVVDCGFDPLGLRGEVRDKEGKGGDGEPPTAGHTQRAGAAYFASSRFPWPERALLKWYSAKRSATTNTWLTSGW